jgi:DNA gyrase subunit A
MSATENPPIFHNELLPVTIEEEMKRSYLDYAMSVIVSRAIPDIRDGLKPVHRRILYAMHESGCDWNKPFRKSARIVGEVMGKYHPHGDAAIYDSLVRMAQDFSLRLPLIDGQGNFGSMDGDSAAAMRYTESRLALSAHRLLDDIDKNTVSFHPNYDGSEQEPEVLPAGFPNLLVNGAGGIAVGMATNIPTHNLGEVIDACVAYIEDPTISPEGMARYILGPDFPTGGIILGQAAIRSALLTGRGSIVIRSKTHIEELPNGKTAIIVTEIPYQVNKAKMIERMADLVREKRVESISDIRDESDKSGVRVVIELKRDAVPDVVLNQLYIYSPLQTSFGVNMLALDRGRPKLLSVRDVIAAFIDFREDVITKRTLFDLDKARDRAHLLIGLSIAVANIDEVIRLIRAAKDPHEAKAALLGRAWHAHNVASLIALVDDHGNLIEDGKCYFTEAQAKAILEMRLQRLTGLEQEKIDTDLSALAKEISLHLHILGSRDALMTLLKTELLDIKEQFATPRKTQIQLGEFEHDIEDLIQKEDMVVTVTMTGYIKRVSLSHYRAQRRGGKGRSGLSMKADDVTTDVFIANTHTPVLFFSTLGKVYKLKVYKLPHGDPQARGRALVNIFPLAEGETINNVMPLPEDESTWDNLHIMFATANGNVRRNDLSDFRSINANGKIAMRLEEGDRLIGVKVCQEQDHILLASRHGKSLRFPAQAVRVFKSRTSDGVRGMRLEEGNYVISMSVLRGAEYAVEKRDAFLKIPDRIRMTLATSHDLDQCQHILSEQEIVADLPPEEIWQYAKEEEFILTITVNGYGKRSSAFEYRITNRGGQGITNIVTSERNGPVIASFPVLDSDQLILITNKGTLIRCRVADIRIAGRNTQGVTILRTADDEQVVSAARIADTGESSDEEIIQEGDDIEEESTPTLPLE